MLLMCPSFLGTQAAAPHPLTKVASRSDVKQPFLRSPTEAYINRVVTILNRLQIGGVDIG